MNDSLYVFQQMAETVSEPVHGVCLTCRINFSLGAEVIKKNLFFSLI